MAQTSAHFTFVVNEVGPYSKSSISAINSQAARYTHAQRRRAHGTEAANKNRSPTRSRKLRARGARKGGSRRKPTGISSSKPASLQHPRTDFEVTYERAKILPGTDDDLEDLFEQESFNEDVSGEAYGVTRPPRHPSPPQLYPLDLDRNEQNLMHYWFTDVLPGDFSTTLRMDGFLGPLGQFPFAFPVVLRWSVVNSAERLAAQQNGFPKTSICKARIKAIQQLRSLLDSSTSSDEEVVTSALFTIVKDDGNEKMHLAAMDNIITSRGGLSCVLKKSKLLRPEHIQLMYTFATFDTICYNDFLSIKATFLQTIIAVQDGIQRFTSAFTDGADPVNRPLLNCCLGFFSSNTTIGRHIRLDYDINWSYAQKSRSFCALLTMGLSLLSLEDQTKQVSFLQRLESAVHTASSPDPVTQEPRIRVGALVFIIAHVYSQVVDSFEATKASKMTIDIATTAIACMKVFGLLGELMREKLFDSLKTNLLALGTHGIAKRDTEVQTPILGDLGVLKVSRMLDDAWFATWLDKNSLAAAQRRG